MSMQTDTLKVEQVGATGLLTMAMDMALRLGRAPGLTTISLEEVSWHDKPSDCWVVLYDRVYDLTGFLDEHPGGAEILLEHAGRDATSAFRGVGHSLLALRALDHHLVGELPLYERMYRKPGGLRIFPGA